MSVLFYATSTEGAGKRARKIVKTFVPRKEIQTFRTINSLSGRLREPKNDHDVAFLVAESKEELLELVRIEDFLSDLPIILILPDRAEDTIAKAHILRPRFLTYVDSDFLDVAAVLSRMLAARR